MKKKTITKMTQADFTQHHDQALAYLSAKQPGFAALAKKLGLGESKAFAAFITDVYVNNVRTVTGENSKEETTSCLLLDRFASLLSQLAGGHTQAESAAHDLA